MPMQALIRRLVKVAHATGKSHGIAAKKSVLTTMRVKTQNS